MANVNKYNRGKIYKLVNDIDDEFYVGSTCETLAKRKAKHKNDAKSKQHRKVYSHLNEVGWENAHIVLIEEYPCQNIEQLKARERYWFEQLKPSLNSVCPITTREERTLQQKEYREHNRDKIHEYFQQNKNKISCNKKEYYRENKDKILQLAKEKVKCECGCKVSRRNIAPHITSKKHQAWLQSQPSTSTS